MNNTRFNEELEDEPLSVEEVRQNRIDAMRKEYPDYNDLESEHGIITMIQWIFSMETDLPYLVDKMKEVIIHQLKEIRESDEHKDLLERLKN